MAGRRVRSLLRRRFGRLKVLEFAGVRHGHAQWRCLCDCGNAAVVQGTKLTGGRVVSCGCYRADPDVRTAAAAWVSPRKRKKNARAAVQTRWDQHKELKENLK